MSVMFTATPKYVHEYLENIMSQEAHKIYKLSGKSKRNFITPYLIRARGRARAQLRAAICL